MYYLHPDVLGTPRIVTDVTGQGIWRWQSDPFGRTAPGEDPDGDGHAFTLNLRFPGQYFDAESGLHYNYFRDYDPATGRYVQSDPIGLQDGINTYRYVGNDPVNEVDPLGLAAANCARNPTGLLCGALEGGMLSGGRRSPGIGECGVNEVGWNGVLNTAKRDLGITACAASRRS